MLALDPLQVLRQGGLGHGRQDRDAVLVALARAHDDAVRPEVHVLDPEPGAFEQAQSGAVQQGSHQPGRPSQLADDGSDSLAGQDGGKPLRPPGSDHVVEPRHVLVKHTAVEKHQRVQRLVLGGSRDPALDCQRAQEARDLGRAHLGRMTLSVKQDVAANPPHVGLLGAGTAVPEADGLPHAVE